MKNICCIIILSMVSLSAIAQQNLYKWRVGLHGGLGTYYGDLSSNRFLDPQPQITKFWDSSKNLSYGLLLEYSMNPTWSFRLMTTRGVFHANDRTTDWNGDPHLDNEQYNRALNFRTNYHDIDGLFIYNFDNGKIFGKKSFIAPYIGIGLGYMNFQVKGDLYQENGNRYYYWTDNSIRDIDESNIDPSNAQIIEQDGIYETNLSDLQTEGVDYATSTLTIPLAMGFKFRLNDRMNLNLETLLHYSMSDYLDDVSGDYPLAFDSDEQSYAANPSNILRDTRGNGKKWNDIYGTFNISIGYNFGYKKQSFNAPIFYLGDSNPVESNTTATPSTNEPVTHVQRDTVYEPGKVIYEKVIIRTDTIRTIIEEQQLNATSIDSTFQSTNTPTNLTPVPKDPVFELEAIKLMELGQINDDYFDQNIGALKEDLSKEEIVLSEVQTSNFELIALRNEVNELKVKDDKNQQEIDSLYQKLDDIILEKKKLDGYQNNLPNNGNEPQQNVEEALEKAMYNLGKDIDAVKTEIIYLEAPRPANYELEYQRIRTENNERILALEQEMRKLRQDMRTTDTIVVEKNTATNVDGIYQLQIANLQNELANVKANSQQINSLKDVEIMQLKQELLVLEKQINTAQKNNNADQESMAYIASLEKKLNALNQQLIATQKEIKAIQSSPTPPPTNNQSQTITVTSQAKEAINQLGIISIYYNTGKSNIRPEYYNDLNRLVSLMQQYPKVAAHLTGFTDKSGNTTQNLKLSKNRSEAVANYLRSRGIAPHRISLNYYGDAQSSANDDPLSRKVEISLNTL